jgi:hypothetical protein
MTVRHWGCLLVMAAVAASAVPNGPHLTSDEFSSTVIPDATNGKTLTPDQFAELVSCDPLAALAAGLARYQREVRGMTATLLKQERIGKTLHPPEVIRVSIREEPFAVLMLWESGIRNSAEGTLYVSGENAGSMKVWRPNALLAKSLTLGTKDALARAASRYCLAESGLYHGQLRTYVRWKAIHDAGTLQVEYRGRKAVPELGGKICHELVRTCAVPECDRYCSDEKPKSGEGAPDAFSTATIFLDAETGYQVGARLMRADGELVGSYFFKDITLNPVFPSGQFTMDAFRK